MKGRNTTVISVRVPDFLYKRIANLANKRGITVNDWCKTVLLREASLYPSGALRTHKKWHS